MKMLGAEVKSVQSGSKTLKDATNEAIRDWINNPLNTHYIIGSVVGPHPYPDMVARFQSIISKEIQEQLLEKENRSKPDHIIACVGGGSNAAGAYYNFLNDKTVNLVALGWELEIITMVVFGGVYIYGGYGSIIGVFLSVLILGMDVNILNFIASF